VNRTSVAVALCLAAVTIRLNAQVVDTTRADSVRRADTTDYTALFLKSQADAKQLIPAAPRIGAASLLPFRTRIVLDRDSIIWHGAETVGDLLTRVPGVYLLRGGWAGRPELPAYQAHGAAAVSYVLDGMPLVPLGQDSLMIDPSVLPLSFVDRVEIDRLPGHLVVWLFTRHNDRNAPYSRIGIASGDLHIARYQGQLEKRSSKGPGVTLAFDHFEVPVARGATGEYSNTQAWIRLDYVRSIHQGVELQFFRNGPDRDSIMGTTGVLSATRHGSRVDLIARTYYAPGSNGLGPRIDLLASRSSYTDEVEKDTTRSIKDRLQPAGPDEPGTVIGADTTISVDKHHRGISQLGAIASYRLPLASLDGSFFWRSTWTPLEARVRGGVSPLSRISLSLEGVYQRHDASRSSGWLTARGGLALPLGFGATAVWRKGKAVDLPAILDNQSQSVDDRSVSLAWRGRVADLEGTFTTNAGFQPAGYAQYPALARIAPTARTDWLTLSGRISPRQWLSVSGWYNTPRTGHPEGQPPKHLLLNATIQSKFLPTYKSGIFNLKMQVSLEHWGAGVLGEASDSAATKLNLPAATFFRAYLGLQIGSFTAYWDLYNMRGSDKFYVPGLPVEKFGQTFGVRWEFAN
jgi:hypothetical protein